MTSGGNSASLVSPGLFGTPLLLCYRVGGDDRPAVTEIRLLFGILCLLCYGFEKTVIIISIAC